MDKKLREVLEKEILEREAESAAALVLAEKEAQSAALVGNVVKRHVSSGSVQNDAALGDQPTTAVSIYEDICYYISDL
jgi:hypothetical protein